MKPVKDNSLTIFEIDLKLFLPVESFNDRARVTKLNLDMMKSILR